MKKTKGKRFERTGMKESEICEFLNRPLRVGRGRIEKRLLFAPMTGLGHVAFRELISGFGGYGLLFTEMCGAGAVPLENQRISKVFRWRKEELSRLVCQIVGSNPETMAKAAARIEQEGFFGVDINLGCSVSVICCRNSGAALLRDPPLAARIVSEVRKTVSFPVFVKFRTGWKDDPRIPVDLAGRFEEAGADALTFHPRVAPDRRSRPPRWEYIGMVKEAVSIPVFGNGDVFDRADCLRMLSTTGCDGVSIGRMAVARPWIFKEWTEDFLPPPGLYRESAFKLIALLSSHFGSTEALRRFRRFAVFFAANFRFGHTFYSRICGAVSLQEVEAVLCDFLDSSPECSSRPNLHLFTA